MSAKKKKKTQILNVQPVEKTDNADAKEPLTERLERKELQREHQPEKPQESHEEPKAPSQAVQSDTKQEVTFPTLDDIFKNVDPKSLEAAEGLGVPVKGLLLWARGMEVKQDAIIEALKKVPSVTEKGIADELFKKSMEQRQAQAQAQPQASTGNVGVGGLGQILQLLGQTGILSGGSSDMQNKIMDMAIESMGLGNALVKAIILKTAPELATQLLPPIGAAKQ